MKGNNTLFGVGCLMTVFGGAGLAEISTSNHGCFWFCAILFSVGLGLCLWSYEK